MKRPHSAKPAKNSWALVSNDEAANLFEQPIRHFAKSGKKQMFNALSASNDLSRMLPKQIKQDKERLYCETLQLKTNLNQLAEENLRLKTKIAALQKEKDRQNKGEQSPLSKGKSSNFLNLNSKCEKQNGIVSNLKKMVREMREQNENLQSEVGRIKRAIRYTKINELEVEKQTIYEENRRLMRVVQGLEGELTTRARQEEEVRQLGGQLEQRTRQLREVTSDNMKYEQILEELEMRNKELNEKLLINEKKRQREVAVENRKIDQLTRQVELLKHEVTVLNQKIEEERKKSTQTQSKRPNRPASSHPSNKMDPAGIKSNKNRQKQEALLINDRLRHQVEQAKRKLAESQNKLHITSKNPKQNLGASKDQTFELVLTKNEANQFMRNHSNLQSYNSDYEQSVSKSPDHLNELPIEQKVKNTAKSSSKKGQNQSNTPIMNQIRQILTYRMKYNRYPFAELKADIQVSPLTTFPYQDLLNMLTAEPFFLTNQYAQHFLKVCFGKDRIKIDDNLNSSKLLQNLRLVIDDFQLLEEDEQEKCLYKIAEFMTENREKLEDDFKKIRDRNNFISKEQLIKVLRSYGQVSEEQINLAICYISINTETLQEISYVDLLDRFYISNPNPSRGSELKERRPSEELSMGENEELYGDLIADDELV